MKPKGVTAWVAGAILAGSVLGTAAEAGKTQVDSKISYRNFTSESFNYVHKGRVRSEKSACERGRTVRLYVEGEQGFVESDITNHEGRYRIVLGGDGFAGDYYTRALKKETSRVVCRSAESEHLPVGPGSP